MGEAVEGVSTDNSNSREGKDWGVLLWGQAGQAWAGVCRDLGRREATAKVSMSQILLGDCLAGQEEVW